MKSKKGSCWKTRTGNPLTALTVAACAPVEVPRCSEAASLGVMLLAGVGVGVFPDISQAVKEVVKIKRSFYPEPSNVATYEKIYQDYLCLYERLYGKEKPGKED